MLALCAVGLHAQTLTLRVDATRALPPLRALHGINKGPLAPGGLVDLTAAQRDLGLPLTRLHDCHWPNPDVVDFHAVFPQPTADPALATSYDFALTDAYLAAVRATGAPIVYRLGESIDHTSHRRFVHPPADPARWAQVALGIIRHYNEGWADGFRWGIRYWEIWNEPENRPAMWSGTDEDYLRLYAVAARAIHAHDPTLQVGGASFGASGWFVNGQFEPTDFVRAFLARCRREALPLGFFSWHCYTADTTELTARAVAVRRLLDNAGFTGTESHLNEWNYLPGGTWDAITPTAAPAVREAAFAQMSGAPGAAFVAAALLELQAAPVTACNLFHGEAGMMGLFSEQGVPRPVYYALLAFHQLLGSGQRCALDGAVPGRLAAAATLAPDRRAITVLLSHVRAAAGTLRLACPAVPWTGPTQYEFRRIDDGEGRLTVAAVGQLDGDRTCQLSLQAPAVGLVTLHP